jgi:serine/threonine protein kinase
VSQEGDLGPDLGSRVGPYVLEAVLGQGGMGIVYRAVHAEDGGVVALKILRADLARDDVYRQRFAREARAAAEVEHPHLVPIHSMGDAEGLAYLAARYVAGRSLSERIDLEGRLSVGASLAIAAQVGAGLDALHRHGLVHRDVKPSNIMLDEADSALLCDFGLAKGRAYTVLTRPGQVMGTLDYLAPELIQSGDAGPPSDIYALGCVVYECLAGTPPFGGLNPFKVGVAHLQDEPPDPCAGREDAPPSLSWAVLRALEKDPALRPSTGTAYAHLLALAIR